MLLKNDIVFSSDIGITDSEFIKLLSNSEHILKNIKDRKNLHERDSLDRLINILIGEIAEYSVIKWLNKKDKYAKSAIVKDSGMPDSGYDIILKSKDNRNLKCSVKSSISAMKKPDDILTNFKIATTKDELTDVNIQVYFWYDLYNQPRITVPTINNMGIISWCGKNDIDCFKSYKGEEREAPQKKLNEMRSMESLLEYLS
ncbi:MULTISPECIES: hypothetical protein [Enterococcus]|jgi:hypothetical protein|uniref:hypothetical protein n=1 Tax=Enterococcus TaxID=1350 RepID=UPI00088804A0|nr:hypothetical protein [Enterococcus casseliflavus]SDK67134.1 hypothetical protein SAMN05216513_11050 [Enterococcus casseliflavus]